LTPRRRLLTALDRGTPDRLPASVHQWQPFHLDRYLGGVSDIDAFRRFGLDASVARFPLIDRPVPDWEISVRSLDAPEGDWRSEVTVTTPSGVLSNIVGGNPVTAWQVTHLVKRPEDLEIIDRHMPVPRLDKEQLRADVSAIGEDGIVRGFVWGDQGGCWQHAACLMGSVELIMAAADDPAWVHEFLGSLWRKKERFIQESLDGAVFDAIETGGGAGSSTVISPKYHREFCLPYDRRMHDLLHALGHRVVYHTCGGMMPILELIVANGCDACETLTPPSMGGDAVPTELRRRVGDRVAMIGGLDQSEVLETGTPDDVHRHVRAMFEAYGPAGGYIASPSDHFFHVPAENLQAYADAAADCRY